MAKVIVERPRIGSRAPSRKKGYRRSLQRVADADLPHREPMLGRWRGMQRELNEHLGPLRRYLRSQVGRPWNGVYHDLREHVSFNNAVQKHVLSHVFQFVVQFVNLEDRKPVHRGGWRNGHPLRAGEMYICPASGLLKTVPDKRRRSSRRWRRRRR